MKFILGNPFFCQWYHVSFEKKVVWESLVGGAGITVIHAPLGTGNTIIPFWVCCRLQRWICRPNSDFCGGIHSNERGTKRESPRRLYSWRTRSSLWCMLDPQSGLLEVGIARKWRPVTHFTNGLSIAIQILRNFLIALIQILFKLSLQILAYGISAVQSYDMWKM